MLTRLKREKLQGMVAINDRLSQLKNDLKFFMHCIKARSNLLKIKFFTLFKNTAGQV